jgi:dehydro coenzyme F420 reductase / coenzyme F420-0:L-glutamate ligase / coenzyme F420-1:gamma-L-glutamate ligase
VSDGSGAGGSFQVTAPDGVAEIEPGDDLGAVVASALPDLRDGDIVVLASKVVSKAEGRIVAGTDRSAAIADETVREVARRGDTVIAQTRHGFVMAAAGVDASNVALGSVVLLPVDPDASARSLRAALRASTGASVGVVVTDTFGRPWRGGQTDLAVGAAGVLAMESLAGFSDAYGNPLVVTAPAVADELASAADLARTKLAGRPVALVRGLAHLTTSDDGPGVAALIRLGPLDMFRYGHREAVDAAYRLARRAAAEFVDVDLSLLADALAVEPLITEVTLVRSDLAQLSLPGSMTGGDRVAFVARLSVLLAGHGFAVSDVGDGHSLELRQVAR